MILARCLRHDFVLFTKKHRSGPITDLDPNNDKIQFSRYYPLSTTFSLNSTPQKKGTITIFLHPMLVDLPAQKIVSLPCLEGHFFFKRQSEIKTVLKFTGVYAIMSEIAVCRSLTTGKL